MAQTTIDAFTGALMGVAVGDALGNPLEGMPADEIKRRYGHVNDYISAQDPKGTVTDDTELTMILAESLISQRGCDINDFGKRLAAWIEHAHRFGEATRDACLRLRQGISPAQSGSDSAGNGAAMRVAPIGLVYHRSDQRDKLLACVEATSHVTHIDPRAIAGAAAVAAGVAYCVTTGSVPGGSDFTPDAFLDYAADAADEFSREFAIKISGLKRLLDNDTGDVAERIGNGGFALESVPFALYCFARDPQFESAVIAAVNAGGDADTNAAIAGALCGAYAGLNGIPSSLAHGLSRPLVHYGQIVALGERLHDLHVSL